MSIEKVDYRQESRNGEPGVIITFTYDTDIADQYEIFGEPDFSIAMNIFSMSKDAESMMANIRNLLRLTVH
jgi:hypothetical protein